ncbi:MULTISPECIES: alpha-2-macroglobulin family protein [unclassified Spirosoma]|uniref:alpha-2-macroglobulin family protein n=1 Tax=unclassified Spirosoma TaxID=2621999 RepID=UPI00095E0CB9|nr:MULTISPECIES: alpha-2-macroglobulin family protein [unclassified Spirosoma]MBN8823992.1 alpha-2-macroglobulin [Spirosoma sp.]OJW70403.1 MAG: alpha-2-macroglobulin [Spirosoma sp. 48-14]
MHAYLSVFYILIAMAATAQNRPPDYARDWKRADSLASKGLPKSALDIANRIYKEAKAQKNYQQVVKASIARTVFRSFSDEDAYKEIIHALESDIADVPEPGKSVLQSVRGGLYWQYFQQNRYKFYNRTTINIGNTSSTSSGAKDDFTSWDARQLVDVITKAYLASVQPRELLQKTSITAYEALLEKGDADARPLRPTLYDLLAHRALEFFQNTEPDLLKPVFRFELDQPSFLAGPEVFTKFTIQSRDSLSGRYQAVHLYQQLLAFHLADANPNALADADVLRLAFVHRYSVVPERDSLYRQTLEKQMARYKNSPAEAVYAYQLAEFLANHGVVNPLYEGGESGDKPAQPNKWNAKQAADICRDIRKRFPQTRAAKQADQLLSRLITPNYSVQVEQVNAPNQPFRALVNYQNVNKLLYRIIRLSVSELQNYRDLYRNDDQLKKLYTAWQKRPVVAEHMISLPDDGDLNSHAIEMPIMGLPTGHYMLLVTNDSKFQDKIESVQYAAFSVSTLGYIAQPVNEGKRLQKVFVTNRLTGQPLADVRVNVVGENSPAPIPGRNPSKTNANGWVEMVPGAQSQQNNFYYLIASGNDTLLSERQYYYQYSYERNEPKAQTYTQLFTDRAIYRPGQPIYVKGLLYEGKNNQFDVVSGTDIAVEFRDQNGERIAMQTLRTNEFGTFSASFTAPVGRLTGMMTIQTLTGSATIRVEEYKRPTFEVKIKPITQSFKLGQTVTLSAETKTFSGAVVDGAAIRYRVVRKLRPRWEWWYIARNMNQTEIANGSAQTDNKGNVTITFPATPDREQARSTNPIFDFDVTIDVTDQAGETRTATETLHIGYSALRAELRIPAQVEIENASPFPLRVTNQSDQLVSAKGQLTIYRLQPPSRLLRNRLWNRPDRQLLTKAEFEKLFPNDLFANEADPRTWQKGEVVQQQSITAPADSLIKPALNRYTPGEYVAELKLTDSTGEISQEQVFFAVVNDKQPVASARIDDWVQVRKATAEPGGEAVFWVGNSQPGWVLLTVEENHQIVREEWIKTDGRPRRISLPVTDQQRGGFAVHFAMIQTGRLYQKTQLITVPFTNKKLTIETQTFRNKLKPGEREEWTLTVGGLDKLPAEVVATLYDASLDAFDPLNWPTVLYQVYSPIFSDWQSGGFGVQPSRNLIYRYHPDVAVPTLRYDQLLWMAQNNLVRIRGYAPGKPMMAMAKRANAMDQDASGGKLEELNVAVAAEPGPNYKADAPAKQPELINPRRNFNETAFFFPQLKTDEQGRVVLKFTMPEALTRWRLLAFAHTKDLKTGTLEREIVTQKELMITANAPRFLREGDTIQVRARLTNLSDRPLSDVKANLLLTNALTGEPLPVPQRIAGEQVAMIAPGLSTSVGWTIIVPKGLEAVTCRLTAQSGTFTDGEEFTVPVLPNRMLVTDSQPFWVNGKDTKAFKLKPLTNLNPELPVQHERLTVEVTSNPSWYALQSLPYLMEYRYECAEQLFSRLYANSLAAHIVGSKPVFRQVIAEWQKSAPKSPLETNEELKAVALENSPWLASARSETERQAKLGQLLDANRMESEQRLAFDKLQQLQTDNGGLRWFGGMEPNLSITLHILGGFGHLQKLGVKFPDDMQAKLVDMQARAIQYVDTELKKWVDEQQKADSKKGAKVAGNGYFLATQYLYTRSFYPNKPVDKAVLAYLKRQIAEQWQTQSLQGQALSAMALSRYGDTKTANGILASLRERTRKSEELGMYWPDNTSGLYWYQTPIETQAYLIEAFGEINPKQVEIDDMKRWLLRQKQTQSWESTKATTEAIYALLLRGSDWLGTGVSTQVSLGGQPIESRVTKADAITGYEKVTYAASEIKPEKGVIQVTKTTDGPAWGALYWQHFEPLDRVMPGSAGLSVQKTLYVQRDSPTGPQISTVTEKTALKPGDLIKVRLVLKTDRAMEYVHLKDSRASGFEPVAALSGYKYQNGLGYYESPRDASTDFFMSYLPVGTHVFEYDLRVAQLGDFSAGVATVQCFYAPEFSAHSAGERVRVN